MKGNVKKVRRLYNDKVIAGFAGGTADAFTLFELFERKLEMHQGHLVKAAVELAKDWRTDRMLRKLEALLGREVLTFCYPYGAFDEDAVQVGHQLEGTRSPRRLFVRHGHPPREPLPRMYVRVHTGASALQAKTDVVQRYSEPVTCRCLVVGVHRLLRGAAA